MPTRQVHNTGNVFLFAHLLKIFPLFFKIYLLIKADHFAANNFLPSEVLDKLQKQENIKGTAINCAARQANTHPGIVVGRLQHERILGHNQYNELRERMDMEKGKKTG